ncbi:ribosome maturation factor RimP [Helicobacter sp. 12S02634-8]|uniref:ribosome maturation factor RimP n=1 Tax=Helicobacter sp. 12S02634-8 TaxID=1476199 RepID=UPI000BA50E38
MSQELETKLEATIESLGYMLYDIAFLKENDTDILRVSICVKDGNITLDQCQEVSEMISPLLDVYDPFSSQYALEVSSPGIERLLKTPRHFKLSIGEGVSVKTDTKEEFEATIKEVNTQGVTFMLSDKEQFYPFESLKKVKTLFKW